MLFQNVSSQEVQYKAFKSLYILAHEIYSDLQSYNIIEKGLTLLLKMKPQHRKI